MRALAPTRARRRSDGLLIAVSIYAFQAWRWRVAEGMGLAAFVLAGVVWGQAVLGIATLIHAVPLWLGVLHQAGAAVVLAAATANLWLVLRAQPRIFMSGPRTMVR